MAKIAKHLTPTIPHDLTPQRVTGLECGHHLRADYTNHRTLTTLGGVTRLNLTIRRGRNERGPAVRTPYRPEAEGRFALPRHEFGFEGIALVGRLRYREPRSIPEAQAHLVGRGVVIAERTVRNRLDRYDELLAVTRTDDRRLRTVLADQKRGILGIDGLQPDVGHDVLWVVRDGLAGEILSAKSRLSARRKDGIAWLDGVKRACPVPARGSSPMARTPSVRRWPPCSPACRTNSASSITCGRRPGRFTKPTGPRRRNSRRRCGGDERSSGGWRVGPGRRRRWFAGTARRGGVR